MTWVKICGITNLEDARAAVEAGADAVGFVFYEKSPRSIDPQTVRTIISELPSGVEKVGVFPATLAEDVGQLARRVGLTGLQLYPLTWMPKLEHEAVGMRVYCAVPASVFITQGATLVYKGVRYEGATRILLDSGTPAQPGGTGATFDWNKAVPLVNSLRDKTDIVIAGGLNPGNVAEALHLLRPWGVDVSSGVEASPG